MVDPDTLKKIDSSGMTGTYGNSIVYTEANIYQDYSIDCNKKEEKTLKMKEELCLCSKSIWN